MNGTDFCFDTVGSLLPGVGVGAADGVSECVGRGNDDDESGAVKAGVVKLVFDRRCATTCAHVL